MASVKRIAKKLNGWSFGVGRFLCVCPSTSHRVLAHTLYIWVDGNYFCPSCGLEGRTIDGLDKVVKEHLKRHCNNNTTQNIVDEIKPE